MPALIGKTAEEEVIAQARGKALFQGFLQHASFQHDTMKKALGWHAERLDVSYYMMPQELQDWLKINPGQARRLNVTTGDDGAVKFHIVVQANEDEKGPWWQWSGGELATPKPTEKPMIVVPR